MNAEEHSRASEMRLARWGIVVLLLVFVAMALAYSIVNPLHEATDELRHYRFVRVVATTGQLPVQGHEECRSQSHHPPLFYALGALTTFWIYTGRAVCDSPPVNPFWAYRYWEVGQDNKNLYLHGADESFPWYGEALAVHLIRALNVFVGAGVVWLTWAAARVIWPGRAALALGSSAFVAFNPMFLYMSGGINNDVIAAFSGAAVVYACIRLLDAPERLNWRWGVVFGGLYGLALLSKFNLSPIIVLIAAAAAWAAWQTAGTANSRSVPGTRVHGRWRRFLRLWLPVMFLALLVAALMAGRWFIRNQALYGEPTGFQEVTELWGVRNPFESLGLAISELPYAWTTLWGRFGYGQIPLPDIIYDGLKVVVGAGLLGAILGFFRSGPRLRAMLLLLAAAALLFSAVLFNYMLVSPAGPNGRFFFPALSASAILVFFGLNWWLLFIRRIILNALQGTTDDENGRRRATGTLALVVTASMLLLSSWVLVGYLVSAYEEPAALAEDAASPNPINARFDSLVTLLGYQISADTVQPGGHLDVELYWQVDAQPPGNYVLFMHLFDEAGTMVAQRDTHPGLGNFPTSLWRPGDRFVDRVRIHLPETAYAPETGTMSLGLYDPDGYRLAVGDANGNVIGDSLDLAQVKIDPNKGDLPNPLTKDFANDILLLGYDYDQRQLSAGEKLGVTLYWRALRDVDVDYVMRFRLIDADGQERAAYNKRPGSGKMPTDTWLDGQFVEQALGLLIPEDAPPGRYVVDLTIVDADSRQRASILAEEGHQINAHLPLAEISVVE
ncbi:MAG: phospholipid carrier-dependent glycosyltransferase [Chloroflexota bacterium]|nr:MAG: phospholipid carrier-dependent glycosyltransferase [Chloroflexota bacterium]